MLPSSLLISIIVLLYADICHSQTGVKIINKQYILNLGVRGAISVGDLEAVTDLVGSGADVNFLDTTGTPLLHTAIRTGDSAMVQTLIELGAHSSAVDGKGRSAFHALAEPERHLKFDFDGIVENLIIGGADLHAKDDDGKTALSIAESKMNAQVSEAFKKSSVAATFKRAAMGRKPSCFWQLKLFERTVIYNLYEHWTSRKDEQTTPRKFTII